MRATTQVSTLISLDTHAELEALYIVANLSELIPQKAYESRGYDKEAVEAHMVKLHKLLKSALHY